MEGLISLKTLIFLSPSSVARTKAGARTRKREEGLLTAFENTTRGSQLVTGYPVSTQSPVSNLHTVLPHHVS